MPLPVVILAGGLGTRMRPSTITVPKALLEVNGRPFADLQLAWLHSLGVRDVVFSVAYLEGEIRKHVGGGDRYGLRVGYVSDGDRPLGTAGALRAVIEAGAVGERFGVINGDSFLTLDLGKIEEAFSGAGCPALMTVMRNRDRWDLSNAVYHDGRVVVYDKTRPEHWRDRMEWIDYGFSILTREAITERVTHGRPTDLSDVMHDLSLTGQLAGFEVTERFFEIGSPEGILDLERHLGSRTPGEG
jgi:NDP-sugar pyrophosphorylase family protein